ncbi:hypothetical protein [Chryseosolibacter indicus]|uniref:Phage protein D n=1 Tax=Chryseosolibacter indicus TaxID=2782351 RepID=A0ABS5VND2_9BACT|nr:hypothetical protein [Chryseosolibacter indicus]MBT1702962.1 hypothetical protein [Chryseosolibacter indicus]
MAFKLTSSVKFSGFKDVRPSELEWERSVENFSDWAKVKLPNRALLSTYQHVQTGTQFKEGDRVEIYAGYDNDNDLQFKGFIRRVNFTVPVEIECEGYSYQLRKKQGFNYSAQNITVKKLLTEVLKGTDIKLHNAIPNIPLDKVLFKNCTGLQVLEWLKEKCLLSVIFNYDELYVGGLMLPPSKTVRFRLGWNVVKDDQLKFNEKEFAEVKITVGRRDKDGKTKSKSAAPKVISGEKKLRTLITDSATQATIAEQQRKKFIGQGYEGVITAFLKPHFEPGMTVEISDPQYEARKGKYFGLGVRGSLSKSGGRQKIKIGYSLSA